jgi:hypothetical protein
VEETSSKRMPGSICSRSTHDQVVLWRAAGWAVFSDGQGGINIKRKSSESLSLEVYNLIIFLKINAKHFECIIKTKVIAFVYISL